MLTRCVILVALAIAATVSPAWGQDDVRIGVLAYRGDQAALDTWNPTAEYLTAQVPAYRFSIVPLSLDNISQAAANRDIEFVLTNPASFATLEVTLGAARIATLLRRSAEGALPMRAATIFTRADRADINDLEDLRGKSMLAVHADALSWWMAWRELKRVGIDPDKDLKSLDYASFPHDNVVYKVLGRETDVGTIRSDVLEAMASSGLISLADIKVVNPQSSPPLPFVYSTALYPEWPFASLPHTQRDLARQVASALWRMPADSVAAHAGEVAGWTVPMDYKPVHDLMLDLRVGPYSDTGGLNLAAVLDAYRDWVLFAGFLVMTITAFAFHAARLNRSLSDSNRQLALEVEQSTHLAQQLEYQALHDVLTRLPNRALFNDRLQQAIYASQRGQQSFAVLLLDLNEFKDVNDSLGHEAGDELLRRVAARLEETLRKTDTLARLGGDEFVILVERLDGEQAAAAKAQQVIDALREPFQILYQPIRAKASIGVAIFPQDGEYGDVLLRHADVAMYAAKRTGQPVVFYDEDLGKQPAERLALRNELRDALDRDEIDLYYQPIVSCRTLRTVGVEALVRWHHPRLGLLLPAAFVPIADQNGLILPLTLHIIDKALSHIESWQSNGPPVTSVALNVSPKVLTMGDFARDVERLLQQYSVAARKLEFEITGGTVGDLDGAARTAAALAKLGISLSLDAFSQRHSSLHYIKALSVTRLKIDRSLVTGLAEKIPNQALVRSATRLGHDLGLGVVAEGVEDHATWKTVISLGCDAAQGMYLSPPVPRDVLHQWLTESPWGALKERA